MEIGRMKIDKNCWSKLHCNQNEESQLAKTVLRRSTARQVVKIERKNKRKNEEEC